VAVVMGCPSDCGSIVTRGVWSGEMTESTSVGDMSTPWFAIAPATMAICRGEARTLDCPKDDSIVCGSSGAGGYELGVEYIGLRSSSSKEVQPYSMTGWTRATS